MSEATARYSWQDAIDAVLISRSDAARHDRGEFREEDHPRDADGKFGSGAGGSGGSSSASEKTQVVGGKRLTAAGSPLPDHIAKLRIPPAWTDVTFNADPKGALQVKGKDSKGRATAIYSAEFAAGKAAEKFARVTEMAQKFDGMRAQNEEARRSDDPKVKDAADCTALIMTMGLRPGSESDTGAAKQAYGATTLQGRHVRVSPTGNVSLVFVGKKGVDISLKVEDKRLAAMLIRRKNKAGGNGQLFDVNERELREHVGKLDGGGFLTKDFRTRLGTQTATDEVAKRPVPRNPKEYKQAVKEVATLVSQRLGNTPVMALQAYINPTVFAAWQL